MTDINFDKLTELVKSYQSGDSGAFEQIYDMTYRTAKFTALKILNNNESDADDVMQDCYIKAMQKIDTLKNPSSFMSWFNMIVANQAKLVIRKNNPRFYEKDKDEDYSHLEEEWEKEFGGFDQYDYDDYSDDGENIGESKKLAFIDEASSEDYESFLPESEIEQEELCKIVMDMIENLSDEKKTAVILFYYNNMTTREISESIGVSENTVKSRLVQAKKDLSKAVSAYETKNGKLLAVSPATLVVWALKSSSATISVTPFVATGIAAGTAAGTVAAGSAVAGTGIVTKIIAGVVIAGVVAGGGVVGSREVKKRKSTEPITTAVTESSVELDNRVVQTDTHESASQPVTVPKEKLVESVTEKHDLGHGLVSIGTTYYNKDGSSYSARPIVDRGKYKADYEDLLPEVNENQEKYKRYIENAVSAINNKRLAAEKFVLTSDNVLSEQAGVRAQEIAYTAKNNKIRPDGTPYTTVFDRNGFTDGSREELRAYNYSTFERAMDKLLESQAVVNGQYEKIGVGVAKDVESDKWVVVIHLYSPVREQAKEELDMWSVFVDRWNSRIDEMNSKDFERIDKIDDMMELIGDESVIGKFMNHDFAFLDVLSELIDGLLDSLSDIVERIKE